MLKTCEFCGNSFEVPNTKHGNRKRFCNTSCSAKWRNLTFGANVIDEHQRELASKRMKDRWTNSDFRDSVVHRMTVDNPVYKAGVTQKAKQTRLQNGSYTNNFKYGNGRVSKYEQQCMWLLSYGFITIM